MSDAAIKDVMLHNFLYFENIQLLKDALLPRTYMKEASVQEIDNRSTRLISAHPCLGLNKEMNIFVNYISISYLQLVGNNSSSLIFTSD
jgi:hypothetical protein